MLKRGLLPVMKSLEDVKALSERERDPFYLDAFMVEGWLGLIDSETAAEYAVKKNPRERDLQRGRAWRGFDDIFGRLDDAVFQMVLLSLFRYAEYEDVQALSLGRSLVPLAFEVKRFGGYLRPYEVAALKNPAEGALAMRRTLERWCDWIEAGVHARIHAGWHLHPLAFDPDPEKQRLAALGVIERNFPRLSDAGKAFWQWQHEKAAKEFKDSPKWVTLGEAFAEDHKSDWKYPDWEVCIISIWPLVKKYNWTYRDLLTILRRMLPSSRLALETEQDLAAYCPNVLGLNKSGATGRSAKNGKPTGWEIAMLLCAKGENPS